MAAKILLVDDDKARRASVREILKSRGYVVVEAVNYENALVLLAEGIFDLILLDITLPDKSGFRVLEFLEEHHATSKVIVLTGAAGIENTLENATSGSPDYITRPYAPEFLLKSIELVLSDGSQTTVKVQIIKAGDFIISTPTGDLDMKTSKEGLEQIAATGKELKDYTVLIDLREVKSLLTTVQIHELASELVRFGQTFRRKTAVLARGDEDIHQAMFFEDVAQNRGFSVRIFTVFEDAIRWLSSAT